jgi:hypothetical protein
VCAVSYTAVRGCIVSVWWPSNRLVYRMHTHHPSSFACWQAFVNDDEVNVESCRENSSSSTALGDNLPALRWLQHRTLGRMRSGVPGDLLAHRRTLAARCGVNRLPFPPLSLSLSLSLVRLSSIGTRGPTPHDTHTLTHVIAIQAPAQKGYEEYLDKLQLRNRLVMYPLSQCSCCACACGDVPRLLIRLLAARLELVHRCTSHRSLPSLANS